MKRPLLLAGVVLFLDQLIKIWVKTGMTYGQQMNVLGEYFQLYFIENNGMAFGMEFGGESGKLLLSLFRVVAVCGIGYYIYRLSKEKASPHLITAMTLIFSGAVGNIVDSIFYGKIFSLSHYGTPATIFPTEGGYAGWLHGRVVDMFFIHVYWPDWVPNVGGELIFPPIFNLADVSITFGVFMIGIFYRKIFSSPTKKDEPEIVEP
jgi:signal peptidase II